MKAIVSLKDKSGQFAQVGGMLRTVVESQTEAGLVLQAERFAHGKAYRVEVYRDAERIYGTPDNVITHL
jgi:hypothetical protein